MGRDLPLLGWKEHAALPELGIRRLRVKLDTGARSSALHVDDLEVVGSHQEDGEDLPVLRFAIVLGRGADARRKVVTVRSLGLRTVRDTGAKAEERHVIRTRVVCGPLDRVTEVTLTDRVGMNFRMILGRSTLEHACLVDPARGYTSTSPPRRRALAADAPRAEPS